MSDLKPVLPLTPIIPANPRDSGKKRKEPKPSGGAQSPQQRDRSNEPNTLDEYA